MQKGKIFIACLGFLLVHFHCYSVQSLRDSVRSTYYSQIGVREKSGHNDGKDVEKYLATVHLGKGYAWCAAFVNWTLTTCGVKTINSAWAPDWFNKYRIIYRATRSNYTKETPQRGDLFGIYHKQENRVGHIGFVDEWTNKIVITVEGNTNEAGSREGDGVYKKRRLTQQIYIVANCLDR